MRLLLLILLTTSYFASCIQLLPLLYHNDEKAHVVENESEIDANLLKSAVANDYSIVVGLSNSVIANIRFDLQEEADLIERGCGKGHFDEYAIIESGDELGAWERASDCIYCAQNQQGACGGNMNIKAKAKVNITKAEFKLLKKNSTSKLTTSYKIKKKKYPCTISGFENVTQVQYQVTKRWALIHKRTCVSKCASNCADWEEPYRIEAIIKKGQVNYKCATGYDNVSCNF